jgi:hypothetical protein
MTIVTFLQEMSLIGMYSLLQIAYLYGSITEKAVRIDPHCLDQTVNHFILSAFPGVEYSAVEIGFSGV